MYYWIFFYFSLLAVPLWNVHSNDLFLGENLVGNLHTILKSKTTANLTLLSPNPT